MSLRRSTLLVMVSRLFTLSAGLVVSLVAARSLTAVEQGFFFTFISLAAAQTLFELGISSLILHHLAHAYAHIREGCTEVSVKNGKMEAQLTRAYSIRYFQRAALLFLLVAGCAGGAFFSISNNSAASEVAWQFPWALMCAAAALGLWNINAYSYLEAFGQLDLSYRTRITATGVLLVLFPISAWFSWGLLSYPAALLVANGYAFVRLRTASQTLNARYGLETGKVQMPLSMGMQQRKMAVSAVAGYITANSFTPYAFHFFGAEQAGQFGLTMSLFSAIAVLAMARTTAEAPSYGTLIALGHFSQLKVRFYKTLGFSVALAALLCVLAIFARMLLGYAVPPFLARLMDSDGFLVIGLMVIANVALSVTGTALRAFRVEDLMWPSIAAGIVVIFVQLVLHLAPVYCVGILAAFNGLIFYPYAQRLLLRRIMSGSMRTS